MTTGEKHIVVQKPGRSIICYPVQVLVQEDLDQQKQLPMTAQPLGALVKEIDGVSSN